MAGDAIFAIGIGATLGQTFACWMNAAHADIAFQCLEFEPPCDLASIVPARLIIVDGSVAPVLGLAEYGRLRVATCPFVLIAGDAAVHAAALRAGVDAVLRTPVSRQDFERCLQELLFRGCSESGVQLAASRTFLTPTVVVDRRARTLMIDGQEVILSAQKFELLCYLVDRTGVAIGTDELIRNGLLRPSQAQRYKGLIQELRGHLGSARHLIRPVPGYGYRLDSFFVSASLGQSPPSRETLRRSGKAGPA